MIPNLFSKNRQIGVLMSTILIRVIGLSLGMYREKKSIVATPIIEKGTIEFTPFLQVSCKELPIYT